jgi:hypothetical protein
LSAWQNFYVIVGSAGGALVGLQFVVIALIANTRKRTEVDAINTFSTPTVVHFAFALAISAVMTAPWPSLSALSVVLAICGVGGLAYAAIVFRRARRQREYTPVLEDWVWYAILPCGVYGVLVLAALLLWTNAEVDWFLIGGATLGLLFIGIRNAWDTITHIAAHPERDDAGVNGKTGGG